MPSWDMTKNPTIVHRLKLARTSIAQYLPLIKEKIYTPIAPLKAVAHTTAEPVPWKDREQGEFKEYTPGGEPWGSLFDCAWFHITGTVPASAKGKHVVLRIDISGEGCIFDPSGCPIRGITNVTSQFDLSLGLPGKRVVQFADCAKGGETVDLWLDGACNDLFGEFKGEGKVATMEVAICDDKARELYYDMNILNDLLNCMNGQEPQYFSILYSLQNAISQLADFTADEYDRALAFTKKELARKGGDTGLTIDAIGHAHIDLAWLWPLRETRRKGARTFSTQLEMIRRYPGYIFGASQAQLYDWVKTDYPLLYEKVKAAVKEGNWEVQGGMWVESDTNLPSGESLTRQFLYGKRFFREEFGQDMNMLWLPDVFGYSAALPQIIKKSGCDYFSTIKLSWSLINKFPYHTFNWKGLDGSDVLVHMPPEGSYNSAGLPSSIQQAADSYQEKGLCDRALIPFGIGDGGGGPGPEHLERLTRIENLQGIHPVKMRKSIDFFDDIAQKRDSYPTWKGELYVERHQGTLNNQSRNKTHNRRMENLLHETELACTLAYLKAGVAYPKKGIETLWKEVLLYQFHDIIPGSSIKRVYDESVARYEIMEQETAALRDKALAALSEQPGDALFNQLPWERTVCVDRNGESTAVTVPAFGFARVSDGKCPEGSVSATETTMENSFVKVSFGVDGTISSYFDKRTGKELVKPGAKANELRVFTDIGDAWDFSYDYRLRKSSAFELVSVEVTTSKSKAVRHCVYRHGESLLTQDVVLRSHSAMVDFRTSVEWQEKDRMLRAEFPLDVDTEVADCDIQFGHIRRGTTENTSYDYAMIEFAAHKWVDLSENDFGIALLNDCKYGHYIKDSVISLNLLRSQNYPGKSGDLGHHEFAYALYPHKGTLAQSDVEQAAYEYNYPAVVCGGAGTVPFLAKTGCSNVVIETVKLSEDGDDVILRLYENKGSRVAGCKVELAPCFRECILTNLIEDDAQPLEIMDGAVSLDFRGFEVLTLKLKR